MSFEKPQESPVSWPVASIEGDFDFFDDSTGRKQLMDAKSEQIFVASDIIAVDTCVIDESGCKSDRILHLERLKGYLNKSCIYRNEDKEPSTEIFFLRQAYSRAKINISKTAITMILANVDASPSFVDILTCFGSEDGQASAGKGVFFSREIHNNPTSLTFKTGYVLKHVEHKPGSKIPWSIRQMAVYQTYHTSSKKSSVLLLQTSAAVHRRIIELDQTKHLRRLPNHWKNLHQVYLGTLSNNWSEYITCIEEKIAVIELDVRFARRDGAARVTFTTLQALSQYIDLLIRISHALQLNISVLEHLSETAERRHQLGSFDTISEHESFQHSIRTCLTEHQFIVQHVNLVRSCAQEITDLVRNTVTLTDSDAMFTLTQRTIQEARSMKSITIIALVYLPASFTATFLSMGFVHVDSFVNSLMHIRVSEDMWFYLAITAPLMLTTIFGWWLWERISKKRDMRR